jgi:hypothetical protein
MGRSVREDEARCVGATARPNRRCVRRGLRQRPRVSVMLPRAVPTGSPFLEPRPSGSFALAVAAYRTGLNLFKEQHAH